MAEPSLPDRMRLFVALQLPEAVKREVEQVQAEFGSRLPHANVRWTKREQFHLTLRFLGSVREDQVQALIHALGSVCLNFVPLHLRAQRIGFFPNARRPRVLWVGVSDSENKLEALQRVVQEITREFSVEPPEDRFAGHVTLARIKNLPSSESASLARLAAGMTERSLGNWVADAVHLMRSRLSSSGASHELVAAIPLGPTPATQ